MSAFAAFLGALARRLKGSGIEPRWAVLPLAALGAAIAMYEHGLWPALTCAVAVPLAFGLPYHGESIRKPWLMSVRNGLLTAAITAVLSQAYGIDAWAYAPVGLGAGGVYWTAYKAREKLPTTRFLHDWNAWAELGLGALMVGGLALVGA